MNVRCAIILILMLGSIIAVDAQNSTSSSATTQTLVPQKLPDGNAAWALDLITTGGFNGMGIGKFSVNSSGMLTCSSTKHKCPDKLTAIALNRLANQVIAAAAVPWDVARPGVCSDCVEIRLQLSMREPDGSTKIYSTSWDPASRGVPEQLRAISNTLIDLGK